MQATKISPNLTLKSGQEILAVPEHRRMNFFPTYFSPRYMEAERALYTIADNVLLGYVGGYWKFALVKFLNGKAYPLFILESKENRNTLTNPFSGDEVIVDDLLAGLIITIYTGNFLETDTGYGIARMLTQVAYEYAEETNQVDQAFTMLD
jgi:hypothetical protein